MPKSPIEVPYNHDLKPLEDLLRTVQRPGDFFVVDTLEAPMPRIEIDGVGLLSFPVPAAQVQDVIRGATRAPYGRGEQTIVDESVRRVWQVPNDRVKVGGRSWDATLARILDTVASGLGCAQSAVRADLYKLLVYEEGGFFKAHRDTEKAEGMFGTLVIVLPCVHEGGELVIRHAGRKTTVDLCSEEVSELRFAAFYADCEHEVLPVRAGHRVCLVYNLIQRKAGGTSGPIRAPLYDVETESATRMLREAFASEHPPAKLSWLLEHDYSPDGLAFGALKGADVAQAALLRKAAESAGCVLHLALVHIEESGPAEPNYQGHSRYRSHWGRYGEPGIEEEDVDDDSFEVVEVSSTSRFFDQWRNLDDLPVEYGRLPLEDGELLPAGALDGEKPDEQRLTEATGNEGATFEHSYHRAALVLWPRDRFVDVLLQSGVGAALPLLKDRVARAESTPGDVAAHEATVAMARRIVEAWETAPPYPTWRSESKEPDRSEMVRLLGRLGDPDLLGRFVEAVVIPQFDGTEAPALAEQAVFLGRKRTGSLFAELARRNMRPFHRGCVALLRGLVGASNADSDAGWKSSVTRVAAALVGELPNIAMKKDPYGGADWWREEKAKPIDSGEVVELVESLRFLGARGLQADAVKALRGNPAVFDPVTIVVPALRELRGKGDAAPDPDDDAWWPLWTHAAEFLLARSEHPPEPPADWRLEVRLDCKCEDCRELQAFALDPVAQVRRFRVRQDRRYHLQGKIQKFDLDMTHVTERKGSPQTLVCTKTRRTHQRRRERHAADCAAMGTLMKLAGGATGGRELGNLLKRLAQAKDLKSLPGS